MKESALIGLGLASALLIFMIGLAIGLSDKEASAVKNGAAYFVPDKDGKPEFKWGCK